ncbi:MAG: hypothetical protein CVV37_04695 [Nitrospira bacterium HGW-Nitrospira-1]|nr:MAG: hypothetical protein CVV37_04695 [Nitrospira bacterium HGW-Nitrospira-1]
MERNRIKTANPRRRAFSILFMRFRNQQGVALILVLWVAVLLTAIVTEFAFSMRTEVNITRNFKEHQEAYYAALAGIEQAKIEIINAAKIYLNEDGILLLSEDENPPARKSRLNNAVFSYELIDEERKININSAGPQHLRYIFSDSGVEDAELDTIVDSILDWRDANDLHRLNGAEEDYYQSLSQPYSCKDGNFDTIEELLLVKGMNTEILYGSKKGGEQKYKGVADYLTAKSFNVINVNTAGRLVLEAWFGPAAAENIIAQRNAGPTIAPVTGMLNNAYFSVISTGKAGDVKRSIKAIIQRKSNKTIDIVYWNDNWHGPAPKPFDKGKQAEK